MQEYYELPIRFTEDQRYAYARWGLRKEKTLLPFGVFALLIYIMVFIEILLKIWHVRYVDYMLFQVLVQNAPLGTIVNVLGIIITILLLGPLEFILDRIWKKPALPLRLKVELAESSIIISQINDKGKVVGENTERHELSEYRTWLDSDENMIYYHNEWAVIGQNTIETIYPIGKQHIWMDHPNNKPRDIVSVQQLASIIEGYLASLEEMRKEKEWMREHGNIERHYGN